VSPPARNPVSSEISAGQRPLDRAARAATHLALDRIEAYVAASASGQARMPEDALGGAECLPRSPTRARFDTGRCLNGIRPGRDRFGPTALRAD
jgi:hypothetical protein